jgi:ribonuclease HII
MSYLIGVDEAGYGPNLGPLVISASLWRVPEAPTEYDLYRRLKSAVSREIEGQRAKKAPPLAIADSKQLYHSGSGIGTLERGVLAALHITVGQVRDCQTLWNVLQADPHNDRAAEPWLAERSLPLPHAAGVAEIASGVELLQTALTKAGVQLMAVRSRIVLPARFNALLRSHGNKASALSHTSLALLAELLAPLPAEPALVVCDKHGGRNRYRELLQIAFPEYLVETRQEGRAESRYCWGPTEARVEARFCVGGEAFLPAALASMTCKYVRELAMHAFNEFWCTHVPDLKPTAGYPQDAKRFKAEIAGKQKELALADDLLWREK